MPVLRDTGASLDRGCEKYATPEIFTGEQVSVKHIDNGTMICLPPAEREIECELIHIVSRAAVIPKHLDKEKYNDQFGLGEYLVETEENLKPSFTKEDKDTMNLIKINAYEFIEKTQQKSKESKIFIDSKVRKWLMAELPQGHERFDLSYLDNVVAFSEGWYFPIDHMAGILARNTRLAVRPAECELAQDGVEYSGPVVGLEKRSPAQFKYVILAREGNRTMMKKGSVI
ncbi:uncharacterized protein TNIN_431391 [Trichonephila inaurata madagascariensis]|uniref:Uncharacterized protein n=1 Tax=Trichonephila inaurata madagascariensis TaxID=2747483 RepID=A0A8X6YAQ0_9ARAC|nr:uncharacterized protein TNIN_431391 [Trichonephila inaurata madagascariensis]